MKKPQERIRKIGLGGVWSRKIRGLSLLIFVLFGVACSINSCSKSVEVVENKPIEPVLQAVETPLVEVDPTADFSRFKHLNPQHERLPCAICHVRQDNSPQPTFAGHIPCASCHVEQFADSKNAICTICHSDAEKGDLKRFPGLQDFTAKFDHAKHLRQTNCADCHRPTRNRAALSIPSRTTAHSACFQCHKPGETVGGRQISSCDTCHESGNPPRAVSESAKAFRLSFSHANHKMSCTECHNIKASSGRGNQVTAPIAAMHSAPRNSQSCATCHNNKRAFGGDDFSDCKRCHLGGDFRFPGT